MDEQAAVDRVLDGKKKKKKIQRYKTKTHQS